MNDETILFDVDALKSKNVEKIIDDVILALEEKGYDSINQIVGYMMSGDPGFISSFKSARKNITSIDRSELIATILKEYLNNK